MEDRAHAIELSQIAGRLSRKATPLVATLVLCVAYGVPVAAQDSRIACTITSTYDFKTGSRWPSRERDAFVVSEQADGIANYSLPFRCVEGTIEIALSPTELRFSCDQRLRRGLFQHSARIDRITGDYVKTFSYKRENGFVHTGSCVFEAVASADPS
jgi:hypothetical protein